MVVTAVCGLFSVQPNALTVCQESRRLALKTLDGALTEALQAYSGALVSFYDRVLGSVQSRYDFAPKVMTRRVSSVCLSSVRVSVFCLCITMCGVSLVAVVVSAVRLGKYRHRAHECEQASVRASEGCRAGERRAVPGGPHGCR